MGPCIGDVVVVVVLLELVGTAELLLTTGEVVELGAAPTQCVPHAASVNAATTVAVATWWRRRWHVTSHMYQTSRWHPVRVPDATQPMVTPPGAPAVDVAAGCVFVGAGDGDLYAVSTAGKLKWSANLGGKPRPQWLSRTGRSSPRS
jgi:hypothetical protein